jgi:hypothetical protein
MLFWADLHGYLTWGEFGDWGVSGYGPARRQPAAHRLLRRPVGRGGRPRHQPPLDHRLVPAERDPSDPPRPLHQLDAVTQAMYDATKLADPSRPVLDASGYSHRVRGADVYDSHSYEQDPERFRAEQSGVWPRARPFANRPRPEAPDEYPFADGEFSLPFAGQPYFVSEYGGIWWNEQEAREIAEAAEAGNNAAGVLGLRPADHQRGGALRALRGAHPRAARGPAHVRLLLHAADRRVPGEERRGRLRTAAASSTSPGCARSRSRPAAYETEG